MKVIFILFSVQLFCNLYASSPGFRKMYSFKDFLNEKLEMIESSKIMDDNPSFLENKVSLKEKLDPYPNIIKGYLTIEKEDKQQNESMSFEIIVNESFFSVLRSDF